MQGEVRCGERAHAHVKGEGSGSRVRTRDPPTRDWTKLSPPLPGSSCPRPQAYIRLAPLGDKETVERVVAQLKRELDVQ